MAVSIISGVVVMFVGLAFCVPLLEVMGTPQDIIAASALYMKIYFLGLPASMVYNFGAAILRAVGDSRRPMYFLTVSGVINVVLNLLFVAVFGMGVAGVAWATVISQYVAMGLIILSLSRSHGPIRYELRQTAINKQKLVKIVRIGLPAGLQGLLFSISNVMIQSAVNSFGSVVVAASAAAGNVEGFVATTTNAFYNAAITFTGQRMGAEDYDGIDTVFKVCIGYVFGIWLLVGGATMYLFNAVGVLYHQSRSDRCGDAEDEAPDGHLLHLWDYERRAGHNPRHGYSILPMLCTLIGACLLRIVWLATFLLGTPR